MAFYIQISIVIEISYSINRFLVSWTILNVKKFVLSSECSERITYTVSAHASFFFKALSKPPSLHQVANGTYSRVWGPSRTRLMISPDKPTSDYRHDTAESSCSIIFLSLGTFESSSKYLLWFTYASRQSWNPNKFKYQENYLYMFKIRSHEINEIWYR